MRKFFIVDAPQPISIAQNAHNLLKSSNQSECLMMFDPFHIRAMTAASCRPLFDADVLLIRLITNMFTNSN